MASFGKIYYFNGIFWENLLFLYYCILNEKETSKRTQDATTMFCFGHTRLAFCSLIFFRGNTCEKWITVDSVKTHCQVITSSCRTTKYLLPFKRPILLPLLPPPHNALLFSLFASFFTFRILPPTHFTNPYLTQRDHRLNTKRQSPTHSCVCGILEYIQSPNFKQSLPNDQFY